jgi:hypothetical protein
VALEAFRVICSNCHGKLVIRHDWLLGQVIRCPRCTATIQLPGIPPNSDQPTTVPVVQPNYDSSAITRVDDGSLAQQVAVGPTSPGLDDLDESTLASAIQAYQPEPDRRTDWQSVLHTTDRRTDWQSVLQPLDGSTDSQSVLPTPEPLSSSNEDRRLSWELARTNRQRPVLLLLMSLLGGLMLAVAALAAFWTLRNTTSTAGLSQAAQTDPPFLPNNLDAAADPLTPIDPTADNSSTKAEPEPNQVDAVDNMPTVGPMTPPSDPPIAIEEPTPPVSNEPVTSELSVDDKPIVGPSDSSDSQPLVSGSDSSSSDDSLVMPEAMRKFSSVFDPKNLTLLPDANVNSLKTIEASAEKIDVESLYHPPAIEPSDWNTLRDQSISGIEANDLPLNRLLLVLGQLLNIGIGWDWEMLRYSGIDVNQPMSIKLNKSSIEAGLEPKLKALSIQIEANERGFPRLKPELSELKTKLPEDWSLSDLISEPISAIAWKNLLESLFPDIAGRWKLVESGLVWSDDATWYEKASVAVCLDQIRLARGLKQKTLLPRSCIDPRLGIPACYQKLISKGQNVVPHTLSTSLILDSAAQEFGLRLLFDWESLYAHGFSHASTSTSLLRGRTLPQIMKRTLDRHRLVAILDSDNTIVVTTLEVQKRTKRTIVLELAGNRTLENVREILRPLSPVNSDSRSLLRVVEVPAVNGSTKKWIVARICPPNTEQIEQRSLVDALDLNNSKDSSINKLPISKSAGVR